MKGAKGIRVAVKEVKAAPCQLPVDRLIQMVQEEYAPGQERNFKMPRCDKQQFYAHLLAIMTGGGNEFFTDLVHSGEPQIKIKEDNLYELLEKVDSLNKSRGILVESFVEMMKEIQKVYSSAIFTTGFAYGHVYNPEDKEASGVRHFLEENRKSFLEEAGTAGRY